ncbi:MAG: hypothetical protein ACOC9R_05525 [bacterium]
MIDTWVTRLREPRFGVVFVSAVVAFLMGTHWTPMGAPGAAVIALAVLRPQLAVRPAVWWAMAGVWSAAAVLVHDQMEDHVYLFTAWLVALALSLARDDDSFLVHAAWQARILIGVTFTAAVAWKLYFGEFVTGTTLWLFMLVDSRFEPLATVVGLSDTAIEQDRAGLTELLTGTTGTVTLEAPDSVTWRITALAVLTLVLEAVVAASHLMPDSSRLAALRLPSVVVFALVTYSVVPVLLFAAPLALLAMTAARWRREVLWVFPVLVFVIVLRLVLL